MTPPWALLAALTDLVLPSTCAACGAPPSVPGVRVGGSAAPWCAGCEAGLSSCLWPGGPRSVRPQPCPPSLPPVHAAGPYLPPLSRLVAAYKDDDRRDVGVLLVPLLRLALAAALTASAATRRRLAAGDGPVLVVPVPTSRAARRRRGDAPLRALAEGAVCGAPRREVVVADALVLRRRVADQAGLGARERAFNLEHAMGVRRRWEPLVAGAACVLVDDVLTTGATLVEAARALRAAGAADVVAATVCATPRR